MHGRPILMQVEMQGDAHDHWIDICAARIDSQYGQCRLRDWAALIRSAEVFCDTVHLDVVKGRGCSYMSAL